ncbi:cytochrome c3 family protein [Polystyrenella longa]|uniref:cytochrome c3 family protein n=1 Tax=Polystyrenella longa TaxID=2528007 RepID=UPI0011A1750F|nr:cytochrome c3 family protein [Polystyrenella longa]
MHPPCVPRRSLRSQRGIAAGLSFVFTIGVLLVVFGLTNWRTTIAPGALASPHAQLFQSQSESEKCTACHQEFGFQSGEWLTAFWVTDRGADHPLSKSCMACHGNNFSAQWASEPHSLPGKVTRELTDQIHARLQHQSADKNIVQLASFLPATTVKPECAYCHQEHQGADHDLTAMTDKQCLSCHAQQFESFSSGHPEFDQWPLQRTPSLIFNHVTHAGKHFTDRKQAFDCSSCHYDANTHEIVSVVSFEQSCADCHQDQLKQAIAEGIPLLALPMIDRVALGQRLDSTFRWPTEAVGDFDGQLPLLMEFLLNQPGASSHPEPFTAGIDFSLVDPDHSQDLDLVAELIPQIRQLWFDLASKGQNAYLKRIEHLLNRSLSEKEQRELSSLLPLDLFRISYDRWFEVAPEGESAYIESAEGIRLVAAAEQREPRLYIAEEMIILPGDKLLLDSLPPGEWTGAATTNDGAAAPSVKKEENKPPTVTESEQENPVPSATLEATDPKSVPPVKTEEPTPSLLIPIDHTNGGETTSLDWKEIPQRGWYRDDLKLTIGYRPVGHADPFMTSWLELAFITSSDDSSRAMTSLRNQMKESAPFRNCLSCHDLERGRSGDEQFNWLSNSKQFRLKTFTKFSHRPHLTIPEMRDCRHCHALETEQPAAIGSEFSKLSIQSCTVCHNPQGAKEGCRECHNYHVDHRSLILFDGTKKSRAE